MLDLSPTKILIILVVAVVLLGPKRLPRVARELGAGWRKLRELHRRVDSELRESMPDLPTTQEIVHLARSPITMLNRLATLDDPDHRGDGVSHGSAGTAMADEDEVDELGDLDEPDGMDEPAGGVFGDEDSGGAAFGGDPARLDRPAGSTGSARRAARVVSLAPLLPANPTDDPHLN